MATASSENIEEVPRPLGPEGGIDSPGINSRPESRRSCSKTPESTSGCRSPGSPVGDDACSICLGSFTDKCAAGSCLHNFCLVCLKEWAKQRPVCPLCKQSFTKILYDIKSETDYKEWKVPVLYPNEMNDSEFRGFRHFLDHYERRFFGYRTTSLPWYNRRRNAISAVYSSNNGPALPTGLRSSRHQQPLYQDRGTSFFRLSVYTNNIWVQPLSDITGRYRESSPQLYREQPALTHRLVPWVNRELAALVPDSRIGVILSDIMDLIERYAIDSREFRRALRPHLGSRTRHFVHEFYNFARSPYDMVGHDTAAQYIPMFDEDRNSSDDDVIEVESDGVVEFEPLDLSSRVVREETIGNDGSVFISSDSSDASSATNHMVEPCHRRDAPPPTLGHFSLRMVPNTSFFQTSPSIDDRTPSSVANLEEPGPSGVSSSSSVSIKKERDRNSADSDDCLIVDILKPKKERTPELIDLSSDSQEERVRRGKGSKKKAVKVEHKEEHNSKASIGRKKPRLDRTSFSLHFSEVVNCPRGEDHTYCTESASPCYPSGNRTESDGVDGYWPPQVNRFARQNLPRRKPCNQILSDSDTCVENEQDSVATRRRNRSQSTHRPRRVLSHRIVDSSVSPSNSPVRKSRRDRKSKGPKSASLNVAKPSRPAVSRDGHASTSRHSCEVHVFSSLLSRKKNSQTKRPRHNSSSWKNYDSSSSSSSTTSSSSSSSSSSASSTASSSSSHDSSSHSGGIHANQNYRSSSSNVRRDDDSSVSSYSSSSSDYQYPALNTTTRRRKLTRRRGNLSRCKPSAPNFKGQRRFSKRHSSSTSSRKNSKKRKYQ